MTAVGTVWLPLLLAYAGTLAWCVERWNAPNGYFAHGFLVPLVMLLVLWSRRASWRPAAAAPDRRGLWLLAPALLLHFVGALLLIDSLSAATLVLAVPGAAWCAYGRARLRGLWPVLWLTVFLVPLPLFVEGRLAFTLKEVAVSGGSWLANLFGAGIVRDGDLLRPAGAQRGLFVAAACSGLRSLFAMGTLAYCLAFFVGAPSLWRRSLLLVVAAPAAILANVVRIAVLCLLARWVGVEFAEGTGHTLANIAEWVSLLVLLLLLDRWLSRGQRGTAAGPVPAVLVVPAALVPRRGGLARGWLWPAALLLSWLSFVRPAPAVGDRAERLPTTFAGYRLLPRSADAERRFRRDLPQFRDLLGTDDFVWRHYVDDDQRPLNVVLLFHDHNWKSVHPPRLCIEGSDMAIEADELVPLAGLGAGVLVSRIVARQRRTGSRFVTLSLFGTRDWLSGDYWAFAWHHLPAAVLRRNESGFLLRVESKLENGELPAAAEARCAAFVGTVVPLLRGLLP
ncbi:MAG: exosortase [Planctomycetes bacterium]|nr:exosortase [Planctomycetota bacterium]